MKGENKMTNVSKTQGSQFLSANQKDNGSAQLRKSERSSSKERDNSVISNEDRYEKKDWSPKDNYSFSSAPVKAESDVPPPPPRNSRPVFTHKVHFSPNSSFRKSLNPDLTTRNVVNNTPSDSHNCCSVQ